MSMVPLFEPANVFDFSTSEVDDGTPRPRRHVSTQESGGLAIGEEKGAWVFTKKGA